MADERDVAELMRRPYSRVLTPEGDMFIARILEFPDVVTEGDSELEALAMLDDAFGGVLHVMVDHGDPIPAPLAAREYSGRLALRLPPSLHRRVAERAALEHVSLNRYLSDLIARSA